MVYHKGAALSQGSLYEHCVEEAGGSNEASLILECVTKGLIQQDEADRQFARTISLVYGAALVVCFIMSIIYFCKE
jgi:hypothetical protein